MARIIRCTGRSPAAARTRAGGTTIGNQARWNAPRRLAWLSPLWLAAGSAHGCTGPGIQTWGNGFVYEGEWKDNKPHGSGSLWMKKGEKLILRYRGDFQANKKHVRCTLILWSRACTEPRNDQTGLSSRHNHLEFLRAASAYRGRALGCTCFPMARSTRESGRQDCEERIPADLLSAPAAQRAFVGGLAGQSPTVLSWRAWQADLPERRRLRRRVDQRQAVRHGLSVQRCARKAGGCDGIRLAVATGSMRFAAPCCAERRR